MKADSKYLIEHLVSQSQTPFLVLTAVSMLQKSINVDIETPAQKFKSPNTIVHEDLHNIPDMQSG